MNLLAALGLVADAPAAPAQGLDSAHAEDGAAAGFALAFEGAAISREEAAAAALALLHRAGAQEGAQRPAARFLLAIEARQEEGAAETTDTDVLEPAPEEIETAAALGPEAAGEGRRAAETEGAPAFAESESDANTQPPADSLTDSEEAGAAPDAEPAQLAADLRDTPDRESEQTDRDPDHAASDANDAHTREPAAAVASAAPAQATASEPDAGASADRQDQNRLTTAAGAADMAKGDPQAQADGEPAGDKPSPIRPAAQAADAGAEQPAALRESVQRDGLQTQAARIEAARAAPVLQQAHEAEAARQVVAAIKADGARDVIDVRLEPPDLGRVRIHFHLDRIDGVTATVSSDRDETLDLLRRHSADLQRELERAGFANVQLAFSSGGERGPASAPAGESGAARAAAEEAETEHTVRYVRRGDGNLDRLV